MNWEQLGSSSGAELQLLIKEYADLFVLDSTEVVERTEVVEHSIDTQSYPPIRQAPRKIPFSLRPKVETLIQEMIVQGIVEESSSSWANPIVLVK